MTFTKQRIAMVTFGMATLAALGLGMHAVQGASGTSTFATNPPCTFDLLASEYGLELSPAASASSTVVAAARKDAVSGLPNAVIGAERTSAVRTVSIPDLDGRVVLMLRLDNMPDSPGVGPPESRSGPLPTTCAAAIYDAKTGEFLVSFSDVRLP